MTTARPQELGHVRFCDQCVFPGDGQFLFGTVSEGPPCFRCGEREGIHVLDPKANDPRLSGYFSPEFTTCVEMILFPPVVWDTNGYYRELGVRTNATRLEIRRAFLALNGHDSVRLTYIVSQLLDPEVRARYDSTPFGSMFRDWEIETVIREAKAAMVREYLAAGAVPPEELMEDGEVLDDMVLDNGLSREENLRTDYHRLGRWSYGYYVWQTPCEDEQRLSKWQSMLSAALCRRGIHRVIAVGFQGAIIEPYVVIPVGYRTVVFISDREWPSDELAEQAVSSLIHMSDQGLVPISTTETLTL